MARYNIGDKVRTTDVWNNGMGILIPKGSIVEIKCDNGEMCRCSIQGAEAWYEYEWLGDVVKNGIIGSKITNADKIRSMDDKELAEFIFSHDTATHCYGRMNREELSKWLQSEAE